MKKLLSLLGSLGLVATASMGVVACGDNSLPGDGGNSDDSAITYSGSFDATFKVEPTPETLAKDFAIDGVSYATYAFSPKADSNTNAISLDDEAPSTDPSTDTPNNEPDGKTFVGTVTFTYQAKEEIKEVTVKATEAAQADLDDATFAAYKDGKSVPVKGEKKSHDYKEINLKDLDPTKVGTDQVQKRNEDGTPMVDKDGKPVMEDKDFFISRDKFIDAMTEEQAYIFYYGVYGEDAKGSAKDALHQKVKDKALEYGPLYTGMKVTKDNYFMNNDEVEATKISRQILPDYHAAVPGEHADYELGFYKAKNDGLPDPGEKPWFWITFSFKAN